MPRHSAHRFVLLAWLAALAACNRDDPPPPTSPVGPPRAAAASAAGPWARVDASHGSSTCGVTTANQAFCWGTNNRGELGDATVDYQSRPTPVAGGHRFTQVSGGGELACGITTAGQAFCWGQDSYGEVGDGRDSGNHCSPGPDESCDNGRFQHPVPRAVRGGLTFASISAGFSHACGVTTAGEAWCWGVNGVGQLGTESSAGLTGLCATGTGNVWPCSDAPVRVESGGIAFGQILAVNDYTCALSTAGKAYCWGSNGSGWLGNGTTTPSKRPTPVAGNHTFVALSASYIHVCGLTSAGDAYCWGSNYDGELGDGSSLNIRTTPVKVAGLPALRSIAAGGATTCAVTATGIAYCWGKGTFGQLGNGSQIARTTTPVRVSGSQVWQTIDAGYYHACGLTTSGESYCWGIGGGHLGLGYNGAPETCTSFTPCSTIPRVVVAPSSFDAPPAPRVTFTCAGLTCTFDGGTSTDDGTIASYQWVFGDGTTASGVRVTHTYASANAYGMGLTVTDAGGQRRGDGEVVIVSGVANALPVARFSQACTGLTCTFDASASTDDTGIKHYRWHFGDNTPFVAGVRVNHGFAAAGIYRVTLSVTDINDQVHTTARSVTVGSIANNPPAPVIEQPFNGSTLPGGVSIAFRGNATDPEDGRLTGSTFGWTSSRDGQLAAGTDVFGTSSLSAGTHTITLRATDSRGATGTATITITVGSSANQPPTASFTVSCSSTTFECTLDGGTSQDDGGVANLAFRWTASGGGVTRPVKTGRVIVRQNTTCPSAPCTPQTHNEMLTVTDARGLTHTVTRSVTIPGRTGGANRAPVAGFTHACQKTGAVEWTCTLTAASTDPDGDALAHSWTAPGRPTKTGTAITRVYEAAGSYPNTLTTTDARGLSGSISRNIVVP